jgi:hypothetical protein
MEVSPGFLVLPVKTASPYQNSIVFFFARSRAYEGDQRGIGDLSASELVLQRPGMRGISPEDKSVVCGVVAPEGQLPRTRKKTGGQRGLVIVGCGYTAMVVERVEDVLRRLVTTKVQLANLGFWQPARQTTNDHQPPTNHEHHHPRTPRPTNTTAHFT